jgi:hypothetical protein
LEDCRCNNETGRFVSFETKLGLNGFKTTDSGTWYPRACKFLKLRHNIHSSPVEKSLIERTMQYIRIKQRISMIIFRGIRIAS